MAGRAAPPPKSLLGRHRLLAPTASVRVSPISLGGMSLGDTWKGMMGECSKETAFELLDTYYDLGGNFIDTANAYQGGQSEAWIGEWLQKSGHRDEMVIATKYTLSPMAGKQVQQSNYGGTGTKSMNIALEMSLKNLQTSYIDIYYVHAWDYATQIPELMQSLNNLIRQGKVLYLGISDTPAWVVSKANAYARENGLRPFSVYQGRYSALVRDLERDIIPMCRDEGMAIHPWGVLGSGMYFYISPDVPPKVGGRQTPHVMTGREEKVSAVLDVIAKRHNVPITTVALSYAMQKAPYIFPMVGGNNVENLKANVEALALELTPEDIAEINKAYEFDLGFPHNFLNGAGFMGEGPQHVSFLNGLGHFDYVAGPKAVKPHQGELNTAWKT
ncbi:aryl-alcohol dehydrogenase [Nannizzia gypsea CBS 118893]|uniref:Aryl-alcohol dehydrogenase n=1 Tax=Arthroderma gypseum (strain ATCC MYA-4604 / CBS 118893) TaxID=535722 RepID=E4V648_ARTGP|nr:aryl-alcohol dehydrogenase [Nannizzia gypsea CBS 118893]EFR05231.1 aryl-alcohol dehydrogenase [Nannizzia gypsea CBS 118893]